MPHSETHKQKAPKNYTLMLIILAIVVGLFFAAMIKVKIIGG